MHLCLQVVVVCGFSPKCDSFFAWLGHQMVADKSGKSNNTEMKCLMFLCFVQIVV